MTQHIAQTLRVLDGPFPSHKNLQVPRTVANDLVSRLSTVAFSPDAITECATIFVRGISVEALIGVHEHERHVRQTLVISAELVIQPPLFDALPSTIDYRSIVETAERLAGGHHISLIEVFARKFAEACLHFPSVDGGTVRIEKPAAISGALAGTTLSFRRMSTASSR